MGVCSLDALGAAHGGAVTVVADARRREVYWARYEGGERVEGPAVAFPGDVPATAGAIIGRGAALYPDVFGDPPPESAWHPDPAWLVRVAARRVAARRTTSVWRRPSVRRGAPLPQAARRPRGAVAP